MHPLIADGGEMTVLRDLAAYSYGQWSVDWPESVPDDQRPELPDDRDFGYASKLKQDPGMFGRRFVRADVDITAQDFDDAGAPIPFTGESNVEETLDETSRRTEGDVFFEREITRAGLGALVPRIDFDVDSVVPVLIWGKTIPAPVTSIEDVVESGAVVDYRVHVGGQLLQDDAARERANREVERTIAQERRERVKAVSKERKARKSAISGERAARTEAISAEAQARALADSEEARARQKAISDLSQSFTTDLQAYGELVEEAKNSVDPATRQVVNFWSEENQNNFNKAVQLTLSAQSAYNDINNIKWVSQDAWNAQQEKINEARDKFEAQQIEIDAAQDEVAKANQKAADAAQQAADTAQKLATENGILLAKIDSLQGELDKRSVGKVTLLGGQRRKSSVHGIGIRAPYNDRDLVVVTSKEFVGSITVQIFYKNGAAYQRVYYSDAGITQLYRRVVEEDPFFEEFRYKKAALYNAYWEVPLGSIDTITVLVDHLPWQWS
uniref:Uncharacterized protein n=1 Tax=Corynebacterium phage HS01 TaxID=3056389 RepID=A0AA49X3T4_9VIRU|nr:MAG: hypothetical protein [Corynebacterium phage HS01]